MEDIYKIKVTTTDITITIPRTTYERVPRMCEGDIIILNKTFYEIKDIWENMFGVHIQCSKIIQCPNVYSISLDKQCLNCIVSPELYKED